MQQDLALDVPNRLSRPLGDLLRVLDEGWDASLARWLQSTAGRSLQELIQRRHEQGARIYPSDPLRALRLTALRDTRVVILGQDPYHRPGQAEGLAFSVPDGVRPPPSLRNIFKELQRDLGQAPPVSGHLGAWARRGVLLLNTCLTVEEGQAASHAGCGWEALTDALIGTAAMHEAPKVFMLWGAHAQSKLALIEAQRQSHLVLQCNHPSPLSATRGESPFVGCGHFSRARRFLSERGCELDWSL